MYIVKWKDEGYKGRGVEETNREPRIREKTEIRNSGGVGKALERCNPDRNIEMKSEGNQDDQQLGSPHPQRTLKSTPEPTDALVCVQDVPVRDLYPRPQLLIVQQFHECAPRALAVLQIFDTSTEPGLDFLHQLCVRDPWVDTNGDQVFRHAVEDLDLLERRLGVSCRNGGRVKLSGV